MKIKGSNVTIKVKAMDRSIAFYESLGLTLKQRWDNHYAIVEGPGITLGIHPGGGDQASSGTVSIGFMVEDHEEAKKMLERLNIPFRPEDDGKSGLYCHLKDPDGTVLYLVKPLWE